MQVSQITKDKRNKQRMITYIVIGGLAYLYGVLYFLHVMAIKHNNPRTKYSEAMNIAITNVFTHPFEIFPIRSSTIFLIFVITLLGGAFLMMMIMDKSLRKHDDPDTVKGEARFMNKKEADEFCTEKANPIGSKTVDIENNIILSKDLFISINERDTHLVPNIMVAARAGAGKGQGLVDPNVLQNFSSQLITDPSGELYRRYAKYKENNGYVVNCLNLDKLRDGSKYNPLAYIKEEKDVDILVQCLFDNLKEEDAGGGEQFWNDTAKLLMESLILYLWHIVPVERQTFENVLKLLHMAEVDENDPNMQSELDRRFSQLEERDPNNLAVKRYQDFKIGAGKTLKSILITVTSKLKKFELSDLQYMTSSDEMDLTHFADTKHVLFVIVPTGDAGTFNFVASMLYTQIFQEIYRYGNNRVMYSSKVYIPGEAIYKVYQGNNNKELKANMEKANALAKEIKQGCKISYNKVRDIYVVKTKSSKTITWRGTKEAAKKIANRLQKEIKVERVAGMEENKVPTPVQFILDEFKSTGKIPAFTDKISTVRKYGVSIIIILQSYAQLEIMYKEEAPTIMSNCPIKILMGTSDIKTIESFTKHTGKKTTKVQNTSYDAKGGGSNSINTDSIELITPDMVSKLSYKFFFVLIDEKNPYYGEKFLVSMHPQYDYAKSTAGKYYNKNYGKSKPLVPLWQREIDQDMANAARESEMVQKDPEENITTDNPDIETNGSEESVVQKTEKERKKIRNAARKKEAEEASEVIKHFGENFQNETAEMIGQGIMDALGLKHDASDTQIKEAVESMVVLEEPSADIFSYMMTN